ncbi:DMT family transporter [Streptomyces sp. NPDC049555]|uniref:DMT family transporter n=1 Tax=Streptomyces sp. NPDC049555 TaxID=3154930 RepID=UPI00342E89F5
MRRTRDDVRSPAGPVGLADRPPAGEAGGRGITPALAGGIVLASASGYPVGALGVGAAPPFLLTAGRIALAAVLMTCIAVAVRARRPRGRLLVHTMVVGVLGHCVHFAGLYGGLAVGVPPAVSALVFGLHPVLTAVLAGLVLHERPRARQLAGLVLGVLAVLLALGGRLLSAGGLDAGSALTLVGLTGLVSSAVWQQRFCAGVDLRAATAVQLSAAVPPLLVLAVLEDGTVHDWRTAGWVALWLVVVNSIVGTRLQLEAVRRAGAARTSTVFCLVPSTAALLSWVMGNGTLNAGVIAGLVLGAAASVLGLRATPAGRTTSAPERTES